MAFCKCISSVVTKLLSAKLELMCTLDNQSRTQSPCRLIFWSVGDHPKRTCKNGLHFPIKYGFPGLLHMLGIRLSHKGGLKVSEKDQPQSYCTRNWIFFFTINRESERVSYQSPVVMQATYQRNHIIQISIVFPCTQPLDRGL